jgi:hypothetical protein
MRRILAGCFFAVLLPAAAFAQQHVIVVDNHASQNGNGTFDHPFKTLAAAAEASQEGDVIYVTPSSDPYVESVALKAGQKLVGASNDEIIRSLGIDVPSLNDAATIEGTVTITSNNVVASLTIVADRANGVSGAGSTDKMLIRNVHFKTSNGMFGFSLTDHAGDVTVSGGGLEATESGGGVSVVGGNGNVFFDAFPMSGTFSTAVLANDHLGGFILFRDGSSIRVDDSSQDAVVAQNLGARAQLAFSSGLIIRSSKRRGFIASHVQRLNVAGGASVSTSNAAALELTDCGGDLSFDSVSAEGSAIPHGVRVGHMRGHLAINGGTIRSASAPALDFDDVNQIEVSGLLIDGGTGIVATRLHDATFSKVEVRQTNGVMLNDVDGSVRFDHCSFSTPVTIDQRIGEGSVLLDRCHIAASVKAVVSATTKLKLELNATDSSGAAVTATADNAAGLAFAVRGGRFTGSTIDVTAADTSNVCAEVSAVHFEPVDKAIRFGAVEGSKLRIIGPRASDAAAIRTAVAELNNGAGVTIEAPAASLSAASKCE